MYKFPKRCEGDDILVHIFPAMQKQVQRVIDYAKTSEKIKRVRVFGSAVTLNCGIGSDLDIAIDAPDIISDEDFFKISRPIRNLLDVNADIMHYNRIHSELLLNEIDTKGVDVYVNRIYGSAENSGM